MKIKRYMAVSMRAALALVRSEQGPDAVILSSRRVAEGIEVIAAVDYDEALFLDATRKKVTAVADVSAAPTAPLKHAPTAPLKHAPTAPLAPTDAGYLAMRRELRDLREMLQGELAHMGWNDRRRGDPLQVRVLERLTSMDIAPDVAKALAARAAQHAGAKNQEHIPLALLVQNLRTVSKASALKNGVVAVVGPTGAGKTTTIAKLAARWTMQFGNRDLALVSTDGYRIGAREQLATYARILGAPMHSANNGKELSRVLRHLKGKKMVLIDTAGMGPRDVRLSEHLSELQLGAAGARVFLALPAQGEGHALDEIVKSFARVAPSACVLTKLDEAASLGAILSTTLRHRLPIAYLCNGQRVPEDVHSAQEKRVWLIRAALALKQRSKTQFNESYFATNLGRATAHA